MARWWAVELSQLRAFLAVVEHGGFRRAAARLHYSQPAITRQVALLERAVGVRLLRRGPGGAVLTPAGAVLVGQAQRVLDEAADATRVAACSREHGVLVVGICPGGAAELTRPLLVELRRLLPAVELVARPLPLLEWTPGPPPGTDLVIMRDPVREDVVRVTTLVEEPLVVAVPAAFAAASAPALSAEGVLALPLVGFDPAVPKALRDFWSLAEVRNGSDVEFRGAAAHDPRSTARAVLAGEGVALTTRAVVRSFAAPGAALVPVTGRPPARVVLASRREEARTLVELVHEHAVRIVRRLAPLVLPPPDGAGMPEQVR